MANEVAGLAAKIDSLLDLLRMPQEILPNRLYTPEEAARLMGVARPKTLSEIPDLPKVYVGPRGGLVRYHGSAMLAYIEKHTG